MNPYPLESLNHLTVPVAIEKHLLYHVMNGRWEALCADQYSLLVLHRVAANLTRLSREPDEAQSCRASHSPTTCMYRSRSSRKGVCEDSSKHTHSASGIPSRSGSCRAGVASSYRPETRSVGTPMSPSRSFDCQSLID